MNSYGSFKVVSKNPPTSGDLIIGKINNLKLGIRKPRLDTNYKQSGPGEIDKIISRDPVKCLKATSLGEVILMDNTQTQKLTIPTEVREFLEGILKDANMTSLDEAMHEEMINELFARLDNYMTSVIVDALPPENLEEFIKMNEEKKSKEEIESYMREKVPNAQEVLTKAFMDFRDMYLQNVAVVRNAPAEEPKGEDN